MMKFVPNYTVSYHGEFHRAGMPFDIEENDADEMSSHGVVSLEKAKEDIPAETVIDQTEDIPAETVNEVSEESQENEQTEEKPKRGRNKKLEENNDAD